MKKEKYIYERKARSGRKYLEVQVSYKDDTGKWSTINGGQFYFDRYLTPKECMKDAVIIRDSLLNKVKSAPEIKHEPTVGELFKKKQTYIPVSIRTQDRHKYYFNKIIKPYENVKITKITAGDIQKSINKYAETNSEDDCRKALAVWKAIYKTAIYENIPVVMHTEIIKIPKSKIVTRSWKKETSIEEVALFMEELLQYGAYSPEGRYRNKCIWYALNLELYCGLRPQEAFAISRSDIDLAHMRLYVNKRVGSNESKTRQLVSLKTASSKAPLPIPDDLKPILEDLLQWSNHEPLLVDLDGLPYSTSVVATRISNVSKKCEEKYGFTFNQYRLRHLFSKNLFNTGASLKTVQALMRHAHADMSVYYDWSTDDEKKKAVNSIHRNSQKSLSHDGDAMDTANTA